MDSEMPDIKKGEEEKEAPSNELALFKASLQTILTQVSSAVSLEKFTEIFKGVPSLVNKASRVKNLWEVYQQTMLDDMSQDMNAFISDEDLDTKLNTISQMREKTDIAKDEIAWRPTLLSIEQYLRSYDMKLKETQKIKLEEIAEKKEQRLQELRKKVILEREKAIKFRDSIQRAREELKKGCKIDLKLAGKH